MSIGGVPATSRHARVALTLLAALCFAQWPATHATAAVAHHRVVAAFFAAPLPAVEGPAPRPSLRFTTPSAGVAAAPDVATLTVPGPGSTFKVPYIQAGPDLAFAVDAANLPPNGEVAVTLDAGGAGAVTQVMDSAPYAGTFGGIGYGEHTLTATAVDPLANRGAGRALASTSLHDVARGDIVAALGDSTTEGLGGPAAASYPDWVAARQAEPQWVSADGRNYPQPGQVEHPKAHVSFTGELGEILTQAWGHPVLVLNLGWSGATADGFTHVADSQYLHMVFGAAAPDHYVLNLGVNDALVGRPPAEYAARVGTIVASLERNFGATSAQIHIACPSWSAQPARQALEAAYLPLLAQVRAGLQLASAPDFFTYYGAHRDEIADKVHPNATGYSAMAHLWAAALQGQNLGC